MTDGDDTCSTATTTAGASDNLALRAAYRAQLLYAPIVTVPAIDPASSVTTFVVAFGAGVSSNRSNWIAWGGSGMVKEPTTGTGDPQQWTTIPTAAERAACVTCRDAFVAGDAQALIDALQAAIDQGQSAGEFSDQQSITESVFELISGIATPENPLDPLRRYAVRLPVLLQSTFVMPEFRGHLKAFKNNAGAAQTVWDAAQKLQDRVTGAPAPPLERPHVRAAPRRSRLPQYRDDPANRCRSPHPAPHLHHEPERRVPDRHR